MRASIKLLTAIAVAGCGGGSGGVPGGSGTISLAATDAPFEFDIVEEASIRVDRVTAHNSADDDGGFITLYDGTPITLVLSDLRNGVVQTLPEGAAPAGNYRQFRLRVVGARLVLVNGNVYTTEDGTIHLTSQDTSGFKVFVDPPIEVEAGHRTTVLLDFDLTHTFHPIPANDPLTADRYSFHPVIHATNLAHAGAVQGTVSQDDGSGGSEPAASTTVYVFAPGQTDPDAAVATTGSDAQGGYAVLGLEPGTYDVAAVKGSASARIDGVTVTAGSIAQVDLLLFGDPGPRNSSREPRVEAPDLSADRRLESVSPR